MACTSTHLNAPIRSPDGRSEQITVIDPAHPLFGRCFSLVSATGAHGQVLVVYRDGILIRIPARATSLYPAPPCLPVSKLSIASIRDFSVWPSDQARSNEKLLPIIVMIAEDSNRSRI